MKKLNYSLHYVYPEDEFGHAMGFTHQHPEDDENPKRDNSKISSDSTNIDELPIIWKWIINNSSTNGNCYICTKPLGSAYSIADKDCVVSIFKGANEAKDWYRPSLRDIMGYPKINILGININFESLYFAPVESANVAYDLWKINMNHIHKRTSFRDVYIDFLEDDGAKDFAKNYFLNEYQLDQVDVWNNRIHDKDNNIKQFNGLRCASTDEGLASDCRKIWGDYGGCN